MSAKRKRSPDPGSGAAPTAQSSATAAAPAASTSDSGADGGGATKRTKAAPPAAPSSSSSAAAAATGNGTAFVPIEVAIDSSNAGAGGGDGVCMIRTAAASDEPAIRELHARAMPLYGCDDLTQKIADRSGLTRVLVATRIKPETKTESDAKSKSAAAADSSASEVIGLLIAELLPESKSVLPSNQSESEPNGRRVVTCHLSSLCVDASSRGCGIGFNLLRIALRQPFAGAGLAQPLTAAELRLETRASNTSAIDWYANYFGVVPIPELSAADWYPDASLDFQALSEAEQTEEARVLDRTSATYAADVELVLKFIDSRRRNGDSAAAAAVAPLNRRVVFDDTDS